jgi:hypothetical protein
MILLLLLYLLLPILFVVVLLFFGIRSKRMLIGIPAVILALPVLLVLGLYLLRGPIQQGRILSGIGPLLSLAFPADDLYTPLATVEIRSDKVTYAMDFTHKYVGRHALKVSIPGRFKIEKLDNDLQVSLRIFDDLTLLHEEGPEAGGQFWGKDHYGLYFTQYQVPQDAPVGRPLMAKIHIMGDLKRFLEGRDLATISISKMSDE